MEVVQGSAKARRSRGGNWERNDNQGLIGRGESTVTKKGGKGWYNETRK